MFGIAHKKSLDIYGVSASLLHVAAEPVSPILSCLYNENCRKGIYPPALKHVKVCPLYKGKGNLEDVNSYRPVSIIPGLAKIFEHGLSSRLTQYLENCEAVSDRQYAYRSGRSTTSLVRELIRRIMQAREDQMQVAVIFCDLSKAFDVVNHEVLAAKMSHYGIRGPALKLLTDFMSGRRQVVVGDGGETRSQALETVIGVAQGSSLSNIMFSLLLNDLPENIPDGHALMYADDVAVVITAPTVDELQLKSNRAAASLSYWFRVNGLLLNAGKTQLMHFNLSGRKYRPLSVGINDVNINQAESTRFLGFQLDSALTWEDHIDEVCARMGGACFALRRVAGILPQPMVRQCYYASVHSLLQYGVDLWGRAADWERVFRMQKRAVRAIVQVPQDTSVLPYFRSMGIMTLTSEVCLQAALYARDHPEEYSNLGDTRAHDTPRHAHRLCAVPHRLAKSDKLVHVAATEVYNRLPKVVKTASSRGSYKHGVKQWLIEQAFYKYSEMIKLKLT